MTTGPGVLYVGLDACDPRIALDLAAAGRMPALARVLARAARCRVRNPYGLLIGALWTTFATGLRPDRHRFHCWDEIDVASYARRLTTPDRAVGTPFWRTLSEAGRRTVVIDVPHARADAPIRGVQLSEWGCHDRHFGLHSWPPGEAARIEAAFGLHPLFGVDAYAAREFAPDDYTHRAGPLRTAVEERALLDGMLRGLVAKRQLAADLLTRADWDLFLAVFGEAHAVGHQQWHLHDRSHPRFDPATTAGLGGDPLWQVYEKLDDALGDLLSRAGEGTAVLVHLSHGMGPHYDGTHLLEETLRRIDLADRHGLPGSGPRRLARRVVQSLPVALRRQAAGRAAGVLRRVAADRALAPCREFVEAAERARQRFYLEPNNSVYGGVRLNLAGREPSGCVQPNEADAVCARLSLDLLALVNVATGGPVVRRVERADRWYRRSPSDTMPDLFVDWERTAPIETVWSPKTGFVHSPYTHWRTGDHLPDGLLLAAGPGIPPSVELPDVTLEDLAPSLAARLGVVTDDMDGRPIPWLAARG